MTEDSFDIQVLWLLATYLTNTHSRIFWSLFRRHKTNAIKTTSSFCWGGCCTSKAFNFRFELSRFQSQMGNENFQRCFSVHFSVLSGFFRDRISKRYGLYLPTTFHLVIHFCSNINSIYVFHSPTNSLFINVVKSLKFTLKYTIISLLHVSIFNDHHQRALSVPN